MVIRLLPLLPSGRRRGAQPQAARHSAADRTANWERAVGPWRKAAPVVISVSRGAARPLTPAPRAVRLPLIPHRSLGNDDPDLLLRPGHRCVDYQLPRMRTRVLSVTRHQHRHFFGIGFPGSCGGHPRLSILEVVLFFFLSASRLFVLPDSSGSRTFFFFFFCLSRRCFDASSNTVSFEERSTVGCRTAFSCSLRTRLCSRLAVPRFRIGRPIFFGILPADASLYFRFAVASVYMPSARSAVQVVGLPIGPSSPLTSLWCFIYIYRQVILPARVVRQHFLFLGICVFCFFHSH